MFVKHIIKTLHVSVTIVWPSSGGRLSRLVLLLLLCLFASSSCLFGMWLYVVYVSACLMYLSVGCLVVFTTKLFGMWLYVVYVSACLMYLSVGCLVVFTTKHPTDKYIRHAHTHIQHTATYQINNLSTQISRAVVTALSTKDGPLKMVKQLWPKRVGF